MKLVFGVLITLYCPTLILKMFLIRVIADFKLKILNFVSLSEERWDSLKNEIRKACINFSVRKH